MITKHDFDAADFDQDTTDVLAQIRRNERKAVLKAAVLVLLFLGAMSYIILTSW